MYQAGVKNITLYENNGITATYYDPLNLRAITDLNTQGEIIYIENNQQPELEIKIERSKSGKTVFDYRLKYLLLGLTLENFDLIKQIQESIYGWCFLIEYYDGTYKFYNSPLFQDDSEIKPKEEMSFAMDLRSRVPSLNTHFEYTPNVSTVPIYRADTTLLTADTEIYTADYAL